MPADHRTQRTFPREGYTLFLDEDGLEIRTDDYEPLPLKLSWKLLERLRAEASAPPGAQEGGAA